MDAIEKWVEKADKLKWEEYSQRPHAPITTYHYMRAINLTHRTPKLNFYYKLLRDMRHMKMSEKTQ